MSVIVAYYRSRLFGRRPGETHEDAVEHYWEIVDRKHEEWRDDQILDHANYNDEKDQQN